jgi:hypothetical protein
MASSTVTNQTIVRELSDGSSAGTRLGRSSTDLVGFYGLAPVDQRAAAALSVSASYAQYTAAAGAIGMSTSAQLQSLINAVKEIADTLRENGLHKGAA